MVSADIRNRLKKMYGDEMVYIVPAQELSWIKDGFNKYDVKKLNEVMSKGRYVFRYDAEYNPAFLQIIPYIAVESKGGKKLFVSRRKGGEERLLGAWSFFGGHINPPDSGDIKKAAIRELNEELIFKQSKGTGLSFLGLIRDNTGKTSEHIGVLFKLKADKAKIREQKILDGKWVDYSDLVVNYGTFESWAKMVIDDIFLGKNEREELLEEGDII